MREIADNNQFVKCFSILLVISLLSVMFSTCFLLSSPINASTDSPVTTGWNIQIVNASGGFHPSIAVDSERRPHIVYLSDSNELRYVWWNGLVWQNERVDTWSYVAYKASLALDSNNSPHIAYYHREFKDLKYAYKEGNNWKIEIVDSYGDVGRQPSLAIDSLDRPHISYYNFSDGIHASLKYGIKIMNSWNTLLYLLEWNTVDNRSRSKRSR